MDVLAGTPGGEAPLSTAADIGLLSVWLDLLTFAVPMNLGTQEGSRRAISHALGRPALFGITFGGAIRITQVFWACVSLATYARFGEIWRAR